MTAKPTSKTVKSESPAAKPKRKTAPKAVAATPATSVVPGVADIFGGVANPFTAGAFPAPDIDAFLAFSSGNLSAMAKSGAAAAKGSQDMSDLILDGLKAVLDESASVTKALMDCHSLPDLMEVQGEIARTAFDKLLADSTKFSETSLKVAEDVVEPFAERVALVVERFGFADAA